MAKEVGFFNKFIDPIYKPFAIEDDLESESESDEELKEI